MEVFARHAKDRTPDSLALLPEAYRPLVASICRRYLREPADREDAVQSVFAKMVHHIEALRGGPAAWLTAAAHSTCVDFIRRSARERRRQGALVARCRADLDPCRNPRPTQRPIPATVREQHPIIAGLTTGAPLLVPGCGPLYRPVKNARVLITKDKRAQSPGTPELEPTRMPVLLVGNLGKGRVVVDHKGYIPQTALGPHFTHNLLEWLAHPRRQSLDERLSTTAI